MLHRIKRAALAIELDDGTTQTFLADMGPIEVTMESQYDPVRSLFAEPYGTPPAMNSTHIFTLTCHAYTQFYNMGMPAAPKEIADPDILEEEQV